MPNDFRSRKSSNTDEQASDKRRQMPGAHLREGLGESLDESLRKSPGESLRESPDESLGGTSEQATSSQVKPRGIKFPLLVATPISWHLGIFGMALVITMVAEATLFLGLKTFCRPSWRQNHRPPIDVKPFLVLEPEPKLPKSNTLRPVPVPVSQANVTPEILPVIMPIPTSRRETPAPETPSPTPLSFPQKTLKRPHPRDDLSKKSPLSTPRPKSQDPDTLSPPLEASPIPVSEHMSELSEKLRNLRRQRSHPRIPPAKEGPGRPVSPAPSNAGDAIERYLQKVHKQLLSRRRFPEEARRLGIEGKIIVRFGIDLQGNPQRVFVKEPSHIVLRGAAEHLFHRLKLPLPPPAWNPNRDIEVPISFSLHQE
jgi:TonB family protein